MMGLDGNIVEHRLLEGTLSQAASHVSLVTEQTVSDWGFTKNTGTYSKPAGGIPKSDLSEDVSASLTKADTALQKHQSLAAYRTATAQDAIDATKQDKLIAGDNIMISDDGKTISAIGGGGGTGGYTIGDGLKVENGKLSVDIATSAEQDNTKPITSGAVYTTVGNINALLATI